MLRQQDLVEKFSPDSVYLDDTALPFGSIGIEALAHYYRHSIVQHGCVEGVLTAKLLTSINAGR